MTGTDEIYIDADAALVWCERRGIKRFAEIEADNRSKLLLRASEWIDRHFRFAGMPLTPGQRRAWPRRDVIGADGAEITGTPDEIVEAVIELATLFHEDNEAAEHALGIGPAVSRQKAGGIEISFDPAASGSATRLQRLLMPYLRKTRDIRVERG